MGEGFFQSVVEDIVHVLVALETEVYDACYFVLKEENLTDILVRFQVVRGISDDFLQTGF